MYVERKIEALSCNHYCRGKAEIITYCEGVFVALGIQRASCCPLWPVRLYSNFTHYLTKGEIFEKKNCWTQNVFFDFLKTRVWNSFHSNKNWARYDHKCISVFMWSTQYFCRILMKLQFSRQILEKYSNIKFQENPSSGSWVVLCGRKDERTDSQAGRHDDAKSRFSQFCEGP